jgi:hypothetical protein
MIARSTFAIAAVAVSLALAACTYSPGIADRSIGYNHAVAESTDELLLLNTVRASKREPTYYTRNTSDTAQSTVNPGLSLTNPLGKGTSGAVLPTAFTAAAKVLTPSLGITEQNQVTLQNTDDQQSMNGLVTPVSLQTFSVYANEGWNLEQLFLLFLNDIRLPKTSLMNIPSAVKKHCDDHYVAAPEIKSRYCDYFRYHPEELSGASCFASGVADVSDKRDWRKVAQLVSGVNSSLPKLKAPTVTLRNDPAFDDRRQDGFEHDIKTFSCFRIVLRALLALELAPQLTTSYQAFYRLPLKTLSSESRYFGDITQQGLEFASSKDPEAPGYAACKKTETTALTFARDDFVLAELGLIGVKKDPKHPGKYLYLVSKDTEENGAPVAAGVLEQDTEETAEQAQIPPSRRTARPAKASGYASFKDLVPPLDSCAKAAARWDLDDEDPKPPAKITFNIRSFESMVYFLGEIIRRDEDDALQKLNLQPVSFLSSDSANSGKFYEQRLYHVHTGFPPLNTLASIEHDATFYYIPSLCDLDVPTDPAPTACSPEFPRHSSAQVLTLLNQLWGLQKSATTPPAVSNVTVINPP